jgi:DNA processing protein
MEEVWRADSYQLAKAGMEESVIVEIKEVRAKINPDEELEKIQNLKINVVTILDKNYPKLLKEIYDPPALLYIKGEILPIDEFAVAIVGSRKMTDYGKRVASEIATGLAQNNITIVSGLALGIDAVAHKVALDIGGRTIGVLANGLDKIYPITHRILAEKIVSGHGAIVSEFSLGTPPLHFHFPFRNRIIAGLSLGVVVIEAAVDSGALITAKCALDQNREVFAIPGGIYSPTSVGTNELIKKGAKLVTSVDDILNELNIKKVESVQKAREIIADTKEEEILLSLLSKEPKHIDVLVQESKLDITVLNATLMMMEMKGKVKNLGGGNYVIN